MPCHEDWENFLNFNMTFCGNIYILQSVSYILVHQKNITFDYGQENSKKNLKKIYQQKKKEYLKQQTPKRCSGDICNKILQYENEHILTPTTYSLHFAT